jgi:hypothetical protein
VTAETRTATEERAAVVAWLKAEQRKKQDHRIEKVSWYALRGIELAITRGAHLPSDREGDAK